MSDSAGRGIAWWLYRLVLLAYPSDFRREHGCEAADTFVELHRATRGIRARGFLWCRTLRSVIADGLAERSRARPGGQDGQRGWRPASPWRRIGRDVALGVRLWRRTPVHAVVAIGSLALGVGVNVAVVNLMLTLFVRPPNVTAPERLALVTAVVDAETSTSFDPDVALAITQRARTLDDVAASRFGWAWLTGVNGSVELESQVVTYNYFDMLGVAAAAGQVFHAGDAVELPAHSVAVISHRLWVETFGAAPSAIGRTVTVNGLPVRILGVAPEGFRGLHAGAANDMWLPHALQDRSGTGETYALFRAGGAFEVVVRLAREQTRASAADEISSILSGLLAGPGPPRAVLHPVRGVGPEAPRAFLGAPILALGVAAVLLLLTCLNLAGLLLARNLARRRELAVRVALGSTRWRLVAQLTNETLAIVVGAGATAIVAASWAQTLIARWYAYALPGLDLSMSAATVTGALAFALVTALLFGGVPAWIASRGDVTAGLRSDGARASADSANRAHRVLLVSQVALSLTLIAGAAAMVRSMAAATASAGDDPASVLHYRLRPSRVGYDAARASGYHRRLLSDVERIAGVRAAALARVGTDRGWCCPVEVSRPDAGPDVRLRVDNNHVTPGFFEALGIPIAAGRGFTDADDGSAGPVAILNRALAGTLWPGENPIGGRLRVDGVDHEVIGVAPDVHARQPGEDPVGYLYLSYWQAGAVDARLLVRHAGPAAEMFRAVAAALAAVDPAVHVGQVGTLEHRVSLAHAPQQALMHLLRACAIIALILCALGLYGQMSVTVVRRAREHAIRAALGASPTRLRRDVVGSGLRLVGAGVAIGLAGAWLLGQALRSYLYGVEPVEPLILAAGALVLVGVGWLATVVPAGRAASARPGVLLR